MLCYFMVRWSWQVAWLRFCTMDWMHRTCSDVARPLIKALANSAIILGPIIGDKLLENFIAAKSSKQSAMILIYWGYDHYKIPRCRHYKTNQESCQNSRWLICQLQGHNACLCAVSARHCYSKICAYRTAICSRIALCNNFCIGQGLIGYTIQ